MPTDDDVSQLEVDAVLAAARGLVGLIAASFAVVEERVTLPQLRVLVLADGQEPLSLAAVAAELGVHPSNATRICDRLVTAGLLARGGNPADRRQVQLHLSPEGRALLTLVMEHRRTAARAVLHGLDAEDRAAVARAMTAFSDAAGSAVADRSSALAWH